MSLRGNWLNYSLSRTRSLLSLVDYNAIRAGGEFSTDENNTVVSEVTDNAPASKKLKLLADVLFDHRRDSSQSPSSDDQHQLPQEICDTWDHSY